MKINSSFFLFFFFAVFCYGQNFPEKFEDNGKFGIKFQGKIILPSIYNDIITYPLFIVIKGNERTIYDNKMSLLYKNSEILTYVFLDEYEKIQILTKNGKLFNYNNDGLITNILKLNPTKTINNKNNSFENGCNRYFIKNKKIHLENLKNGYLDYDIEYKKYGKNVKFLNNMKKMEIEYLYSYKKKQQQDSIIADIAFDEEIYFKPLKTNYIVSKIKGKYGVWDFVNEKIILSYDYEKIVPYHNYLMIKKNKLYTFYPNIGTKPKYKKLEPYIGYFARFETIDNKKGWVDRKGKEYFNE
ncbi:hypothetical protein ACFQO9_07515 [Chryseobacterium zhengzhouense]|uniref:WG repeat-containing protein n=1 Tax=Chryseobacterium zhengzhouense TaxID=1636086 RepID=A0ABW2LXY0_9FLAO